MSLTRIFNNRQNYSYVKRVKGVGKETEDYTDKIIESFDREKKEYTNKLKEEFINNISHDFKTPLTIIIGYTQLLKEEKYTSNEAFSNALDYIETESKKLNSMIDNLIDKTRHS